MGNYICLIVQEGWEVKTNVSSAFCLLGNTDSQGKCLLASLLEGGLPVACLPKPLPNTPLSSSYFNWLSSSPSQAPLRLSVAHRSDVCTCVISAAFSMSIWSLIFRQNGGGGGTRASF